MENGQGAYCNFFGTYGSVYTLLDQDGHVFYVGATTSTMQERLQAHINNLKFKLQSSKKNFSKKEKRIIESDFIIYARVELTMWVTGRTPREAQRDLVPFEKAMIDFFTIAGCELCNEQMVKETKYPIKKAA